MQQKKEETAKNVNPKGNLKETDPSKVRSSRNGSEGKTLQGQRKKRFKKRGSGKGADLRQGDSSRGNDDNDKDAIWYDTVKDYDVMW